MKAGVPIPEPHTERTFGCEFEWCVGYEWENDIEPSSPDIESKAPIIRVPRKIQDKIPGHIPDDQRHLYAHDYVLADISNTLKEYGLPVQRSNNPHGILDTQEHRMAPYRGWTVKQDSTIRGPTESECYWCPVEITSPAAVASDEAFSSISRVVSLLTSKYRIQVNPSCGFHVHVGQGPKFIKLWALCRIAGILWAADPLLGCLHPPERRFNYWAQNIRERSRLALGQGDLGGTGIHHPILPEQCIHGVISYRGSSHNKTAPSDNELLIQTIKERADRQGQYPEACSNVSSPSDASTRLIPKREGPRIPFPRYTAEDESRLIKVTEYGLPENRAFILEPKASTDLGVFYGVNQILSSPFPCSLPWLLESSSRPNYNFKGYACHMLSDTRSQKRTVEFREAAGTTSGTWAETWARICVGIYIWAVQASFDEYLAVLDNCDWATKGGEYDVIDFLGQLGLRTEAMAAETRVRNQDLWE